MKISIVIPIHNEEECIEKVISDINSELTKEGINYEIIAVEDNSTDNSYNMLDNLSKIIEPIKIVRRKNLPGFGMAIREGLEHISGDAIIIAMGDGSDDPKDIVKYCRKLENGFDCVFGSRFMRGTVVKDYPKVKYFINRIANNLIRILFLIRFNDITNAFKAYRKEVIEAIRPILSLHFNITAELPLKAIIRGFSYTVVPINWYGRTSGVSKLKIKHLGKKYLFTVLYVFLEKILIKDDILTGYTPLI